MIIYDENNFLNEILNKLESIDVFTNGKQQTLLPSESKFHKIVEKLTEVFNTSHIEPAFGVSLHDLTMQAIKQDKWLQLNFNEELTINNLPFTSLLLKAEETFGLNLTRKFNGKYEGRCIYLVLNDFTNLEELTK